MAELAALPPVPPSPGKVFLDNTGRLKYALRAIMNAVYISPFTTLTGTGNASFCSIWTSRQ